uniref:Uncharacterized protein n=1 Tax=Helianthus annuus TaxID=4232 RepID=A0A251VLT2_HELAN
MRACGGRMTQSRIRWVRHGGDSKDCGCIYRQCKQLLSSTRSGVNGFTLDLYSPTLTLR